MLTEEKIKRFESCLNKSVTERIKSGFIYTYKPVQDDEEVRLFESMDDYKKWIMKNCLNFWENIIKFIEYLKELAYQQKEVEHFIKNLMTTIIEHIVKIIIFKNHRDRNKWIREIASKLWEIQGHKVKLKKPYFKKEKYFELLYNEPFLPDEYDVIPRYIEKINSDYNTNIEIDTKQNKKIYVSIKLLFKDISEELSKGILDTKDIKQRLNKLEL